MEGSNPFETFPEQVQDDVEGLVWLGYLEDSFSKFGHSFVMRTLRGDEELLAGVVTKEYEGTIGEARALSWAQVALSLVAVDGEEDFCPPIGPDKTVFARARFRYVTSNWYWPLGQYLYSRYVQMLQRQVEAVNAVSDLSEGDLMSFMPFADSSTDKGDSETASPEPEENIREFLKD